jgi:hypothetical protein
MKITTLRASATVLVGLLAAGCSNQLSQPWGQPANLTEPQTYSFDQPNYPNAGATIRTEPAGGTGTGYLGTADAPLVPPDNPILSGQATVAKQQNSGYFPSADTPLVPPNPSSPQ